MNLGLLTPASVLSCLQNSFHTCPAVASLLTCESPATLPQNPVSLLLQLPLFQLHVFCADIFPPFSSQQRGILARGNSLEMRSCLTPSWAAEG